MTLLVILIIIAVLVIGVIAIYNKPVRLRNTVKSSWSDIDVQCKKRYDLVPNLVETVKRYASHERTVFEKVTEPICFHSFSQFSYIQPWLYHVFRTQVQR